MQGLINPKLYILGQKVYFYAKIARNWKMFVEFVFKEQIVYKLAQG